MDELNGILKPGEVQVRLRNALSLLRNQTNDSMLRHRIDSLLGKCNPVQSAADRLPIPYRTVVCIADRASILENHMIGSILAYGRLARGEEKTNRIPDLDVLEAVATIGFNLYHAVPKERNSAIHVLRTEGEHRTKLKEWEQAAERAEHAKMKRMLGDDADLGKGVTGG